MQQIKQSTRWRPYGGRAGSLGDGGWGRVQRLRRDAARCGPGEWRGRAGVDDDGGAAEVDAAEGGRDEIDIVDRKVEDEQNRNRSIYIGRDPLVPAGNTSRD